VGAGEGDPLSGPGVVVLARTDSARLPGKAIAEVAGRPMLELVVDRLRPACGDALVVATTDRGVDDDIAALARARGWSLHRGSTEDVLGRLRDAGTAAGFDPVVRISGDSPFIDAATVRRLLEEHESAGAELTTNVFPRTFPAGASVEVLTMALLDRLAATVTDPDDREHVTRWCYANPGDVRIHNVERPPLRDVHLAVDTADDLARARFIADRLGTRVLDAGLDEIATLAREWEQHR
jgi:spore coat polysaccharide biosynthesis protein SpsF